MEPIGRMAALHGRRRLQITMLLCLYFGVFAVLTLQSQILLAEPLEGAESPPKEKRPGIVVGVTSHEPPFSSRGPNGDLQGFNVDLARALCQAIGDVCTLKDLPFSDVLDGVANGTLTIGIVNALKTPEREARMLFSQPIWRSTSSFVGKTSLPRIPFDALREQYVLCAVIATRQSAYLHRLPGPKDHVQDYPRHMDMQMAAIDGHCDLILFPTTNALDFLNSPRGQGFDYYGPPLEEPALSGYVHIVVTPGQPSLVKKIDDAMESMRRDGSYQTLIFHYFPFDIL